MIVTLLITILALTSSAEVDYLNILLP